MLGCRHSTSESKWVYVDKLISIDDIRSTPNLTLCLKKSEVLLPEVQDICKLNLVSVFRVRKFRKPFVPQSRAEFERVPEELAFDQGDRDRDLAESLVCLGPLGAGPSGYVLPHHEGHGVHSEVFQIHSTET